MRAIYRKTMLERINEMRTAAHRQNREIDHIEVSPEEFKKLFREVHPDIKTPCPTGRGLGRFVALGLDIKVVDSMGEAEFKKYCMSDVVPCGCSGAGACFAHR